MELFCDIPCLTERSGALSGIELCKKWFKGADKRIPGEALQKFAVYNSHSFGFLEVTPFIVGTDHRASIAFRSTRFIGTIPLRAPDTGKQIGDFVVSPRFVGRERYEDYIEILDLLGSEISPEFVDSLPLVSGRNFRPPFYLEAVKFVKALEEMLRRHWRKFDSVDQISDIPQGQVNWNKYILHESEARNKLRFPVQRNVLSELHREFGQIRFVFDTCSKELLSPTTPQKIRAAFRSRLSFIEKRLYLHKPIPTNVIWQRASDSPAVKECKWEANKILRREFDHSTAWRVDFNDVFEKFVQHIFKEVARAIGGKVFANAQIQTRAIRYFSWELRHLEPDVVLLTEDLIAFIDAKYKSHLFNRFEDTDLLKSDFRSDLHQVLAYTSFTETGKKLGMICYPASEIEVKTTKFKNGLNGASNRIMIVGIPLRRNVIRDAVGLIVRELTAVRKISSDKGTP